MKLKFERASLEYTCKSISEFFYEEQSKDFQEYICEIYTSFDMEKIKNMDIQEKLNYIKQNLKDLYENEAENINKKINEYQKEWNKISTEILKCYKSIFSIDVDEIFGDIIVQVGLNPICPRYLNEHKFDCFYKLNAQSAMENTIHELTHFVWFEVWKQVFKNSDEQYFEYPHLIWLFSEIAIDPILRDHRLKKYCKLEKPAYDYFYNIEINNSYLIEEIRSLYTENTLEDFMKKGLDYCEKYRDILKKYI
ncbi:hypothetical protein SAMN04488528_1009129 [Clostridium frigidicarnis]|uniref:Uncharacterized protein n=1 Tax=Clostridium frigidicarnis TaxID=84698 RepID=A0A1I0XUB7_9CLOT|nr:hypothetical protein SAMN04488528_1009129 [Clostridium frigidicarnis]